MATQYSTPCDLDALAVYTVVLQEIFQSREPTMILESHLDGSMRLTNRFEGASAMIYGI